jgi:hypothetical protein
MIDIRTLFHDAVTNPISWGIGIAGAIALNVGSTFLASGLQRRMQRRQQEQAAQRKERERRRASRRNEAKADVEYRQFLEFWYLAELISVSHMTTRIFTLLLSTVLGLSLLPALGIMPTWYYWFLLASIAVTALVMLAYIQWERESRQDVRDLREAHLDALDDRDARRRAQRGSDPPEDDPPGAAVEASTPPGGPGAHPSGDTIQ